MKVLVLNGSPKEISDTMVLTKAFLGGLNSENDHEIKIVNAIEKNIKFCTGCMSCWFRQDGHCVIQDDMNEILDDMTASDMIVWSFPIHYHGMPASLKAILDRTIAFLKINMKATGDIVDHEKIVDLSAKKNVIIVGGGYPYYPGNFAALKLHMQTVFGNPTIICVCETALLNVPNPELEPVKNQFLAKITEAGKEFTKAGCIADEMLQALEMPMLPNEMYINIINNMQG